MTTTRKRGLRPHIVESDGVTVWVDTAVACVGRFGVHGIDIHREIGDQSLGECLFCTHQETTVTDWLTFKVKMLELYGIAVLEKHRPMRFDRE